MPSSVIVASSSDPPGPSSSPAAVAAVGPPRRAAPGAVAAVAVHAAAAQGDHARGRSGGGGVVDRGGGEGGGLRGVRHDVRRVRRLGGEGRQAAPRHPQRRRRHPRLPRAGRFLPGIRLGTRTRTTQISQELVCLEEDDDPHFNLNSKSILYPVAMWCAMKRTRYGDEPKVKTVGGVANGSSSAVINDVAGLASPGTRCS